MIKPQTKKKKESITLPTIWQVSIFLFKNIINIKHYKSQRLENSAVKFVQHRYSPPTKCLFSGLNQMLGKCHIFEVEVFQTKFALQQGSISPTFYVKLLRL